MLLTVNFNWAENISFSFMNIQTFLIYLRRVQSNSRSSSSNEEYKTSQKYGWELKLIPNVKRNQQIKSRVCSTFWYNLMNIHRVLFFYSEIKGITKWIHRSPRILLIIPMKRRFPEDRVRLYRSHHIFWRCCSDPRKFYENSFCEPMMIVLI